MTLLVYQVHHPYVLQVEASNPASGFSLDLVDGVKQEIRQIIRTVIQSPEEQRLDFTERHYAMIAWRFMCICLTVR